jgi:cytochrome c oxidase cbb3-type subunit 3
MSDFVNEFWNWYVILIVLVSVVACAVILGAQSIHKPAPRQVGTTGHVWDEDLEELNNPLPKWWSWLFYITVVFSLVYAVLYPTLGSYQGLLNWSSAGQHKAEVDKVNAEVKPIFDKYLKMDLKAVAADKEAVEIGKRLYLTYCMQCHGSDGRGSKGFPNLANDDWQWGGEPEQVLETLNNGRMGMMPPFAHLGDEPIKDLANYVRSLSGMTADAARVARGKEAFDSAGCSGCHGADAKGMQALGAPNLTDKVWLYSGTEAAIVETIAKGRNNQMPAWKEFLGDAKIHLLSAYVLNLSTSVEKK